jgi:predicted MFS family arabinose efflux permease
MARVRRWLSENALAVSGGALMGVAFTLLVLPWSWLVLPASTFLLGLGYAALHTTLQLRGTEISSAARGKAFSLFAFSLFAGIATGTAAFGRLVDAGWYELAFAISAAGLVAVGIGTALAGRSPKR